MILVTGGAGYVGSVIVHKLIKAHHQVIVIDLNQNPHHLPSSIHYYCGDVGDVELLKKIFSTHVACTESLFGMNTDVGERHAISHVIHCAAFIDVGESMTNPIKYFDNNVGKMIKLLDIMLLYECKNIIFSSTCATYGMPESLPLLENHPQKPINVYGWTKLMYEQMLQKMHDIHGFNVVIFRYFNAAGAYIDNDVIVGENHQPETHLIPLAIKALITNQPFKVYGTDYDTPDGTCIRDYIHVEDLADAHVLSLGTCGTYNLGSGSGYSVKEMLNFIEHTSHKKLIINECSRREGDPAMLYANSLKFKTCFNWEPRHTIESIISSAYKWHTL